MFYNVLRLTIIIITSLGVTGHCDEVSNKKQLKIAITENGVIRISHLNSDLHNLHKNIEFDFGMPKHKPGAKYNENGQLPVNHILWEHDGIKYQMTLFVGNFDGRDESFKSQSIDEKVLYVRISGENLNSEYKEAEAGFSVKLNDKPVRLKLKDGFVFDSNIALISYIDIPTGCSVKEDAYRLHFSGSMPPGTSGFMVFKIPLVSNLNDSARTKLSESEFDSQFQMLKRISSSLTSNTLPVAIEFIESKK